MKKIIILLFGSIGYLYTSAQSFYFPKTVVTDSAELVNAMPVLARNVIGDYKDKNQETYLNTLFKMQIVAGDYETASATIDSYRKIDKVARSSFPYLDAIQFE